MSDASPMSDLRGELAALRQEFEARVSELETRLTTRIAAAERTTQMHEQADATAFSALHSAVAELKNTVLETQSSHEATAMAQMHVLGLVARKVGVSQKSLKNVRGL